MMLNHGETHRPDFEPARNRNELGPVIRYSLDLDEAKNSHMAGALRRHDVDSGKRNDAAEPIFSSHRFATRRFWPIDALLFGASRKASRLQPPSTRLKIAASSPNLQR
jgi:hypothetical protein